MKNASFLIAFCALALVSASVYGQTAAAAKETPKAKDSPAIVEFTPDQTKQASAARDRARLAALEAENLGLKIEAAQKQYQTLRDEAEKAQARYVATLRDYAEAAGISRDDLANYDFTDVDGKFVFKRKPALNVAPENQVGLKTKK